MIVLSQLMHEVSEYVATVDDMYGHYLDSTRGFAGNLLLLANVQRKAATLVRNTNFDAAPFIYGDGAPTDASTRLQHRTTMGSFRKRNTRGGHNYVMAAQLLVVLVFEYWESEHRIRVAAALGLNGGSSSSMISTDSTCSPAHVAASSSCACFPVPSSFSSYF